MPNDYWDGVREAHLDRRQITADWGSGDFSGHRIAFANQVFHVWFEARAGIAACGDPTERAAMTQELEDAGRTGSGWGIDDLEEAFQHLDTTGGQWTDNTEEGAYVGGDAKFSELDVRHMPVPFVAFANAVDRRLTRVRNAMTHYHNAVESIDRELHSGHTDWDEVYRALNEIKDWAIGVGPFLWARPRPPGGAYTPERFASTRSPFVTFASALGRVVSGATSYQAAREQNFPSGEAAAIALLRVAVSFVPVLGGYYGAMVELIPSLRTLYTNLTADYVRRIDREAFGRH